MAAAGGTNPTMPATQPARLAVHGLKDTQTAGIPMPETTRQGIIRYLQSVASHSSGGLASYRPLETPSRTMTAEAMLCWQFLGISRDHPACDEAANYLLSAPPGVGPTNFYYWYYGTLVMYQFQGDGWQRWNTAVATSWWACKTRKARWPAPGTPIPCGAATAAGSTARPWERCAWRSITGFCRSMEIGLSRTEFIPFARKWQRDGINSALRTSLLLLSAL